MKTKTTFAAVAAAALLMSAGCARENRTAENVQPTDRPMTEAQQQREQSIAKMEQRVQQLEGRIADMRNQPAGQRAIPADRVENIEESIREVREEIADLRNARTEDWWGTTQRSVERSRQDIEDDIGRQPGTGTRARTEDRPASTPQAQTAATEREQFIARMDQDINNLERELANVRNQGEVEDVREELNDLRSEVASLRNVNQDNWWQHTERRLERSMDRIERSFENRDDNRDTRQNTK